MADRAVEHGNEAQLEFLYRVLNEELASRQRARVEKLTNTAGFPRRYVFDQFEATDVQFPPSVSCESLRQLDFYHDEEKRNIVTQNSGNSHTKTKKLHVNHDKT